MPHFQPLISLSPHPSDGTGRDSTVGDNEARTGVMEVDDRARGQVDDDLLSQASVATAPMFNSGSNLAH
jgi:hypothetical protein